MASKDVEASAGHTHSVKKSEVAAQEVLKSLDASDSWFDIKQIKCIVTSGGGFMTDAYDLFIISLITKLIGRCYYPDVRYYSPTMCTKFGNPVTQYQGTTSWTKHMCGTSYKSSISWNGVTYAGLPGYLNATYGPGPNSSYTWDDTLVQWYIPSDLPTNSNFALQAVALIGAIVGQLTFGRLGDLIGRKIMQAITLVIMICGALCQSMSFGSTPDAVIGTLCFWRFLLGVGIGGNYPLSATVMSETSTTKTRGTYVAAVFAQQGTGYLIAGTVTIIIASIWTGYDSARDFAWRLALAIGALPPLTSIIMRVMQPETERYTIMVQGDVAAAAAAAQVDVHSQSNALHLKKKEVQWGPFLKRFGWPLFGCASTWFLLDIAFYSQSLFQSDVFTVAGWLPPSQTMTGISELYNVARCQLIVALASVIPGYWFTVAFIEVFGRIPIQVMGFVLMTTFMGILAGMYPTLKGSQSGNFVALYALTFFFANFGPNATTYILPSELFPARFRSSAHGFCAACGKVGAVVGTFGFGFLKDTPNANAGLQNALGVLTAVNFIGLVCTYPIPEPRGKTLEDITEETKDISGIEGESMVSVPDNVMKLGQGVSSDVALSPAPHSAVPQYASNEAYPIQTTQSSELVGSA